MNQSHIATDHDACGVGLVAQIGGVASREIVERALEALIRLAHRGGVDADGRSGDGAGLLAGVPDQFIRKSARQAGIELPAVFGLGMVFLPPGGEELARNSIVAQAKASGLVCLGWRPVPTDPGVVGPRAYEALPVIEQCFFAPESETPDFESLLFHFRKRAEAAAPLGTYFCSLSSRTVVYKGLLTPCQLPAFYSDLRDSDFASSFAIFHQRYSTNTQPSWSLAQPFRFVAHNGEINTISSNRRWLRAKSPKLLHDLGFPEGVRLLEDRVSDSASFDNGFELRLRQGFSPAEAMLGMVPPAWERSPEAAPELRSFLEEQSRQQEPWDGPAALIFTDGITVGAKLDRNGLRPLRYTLTSDGLLVVGSEVGIADLSGKEIVERQRLGPGEILLVNPVSGEFVRPRDSLRLRDGIRPVSSRPTLLIAPTANAYGDAIREPKQMMAAMGWSEDQFRLLFQPLVEQGQEAVWSMGDDAPPASLSGFRRPLWDYCKQRFAQVTNPPIDSLRETHVMSLKVFLGRAALNSPLLDAGQLKKLEKSPGTSERVPFTFLSADGAEGAKAGLKRLREDANLAAAKNPGLIVLTDRGVDADHAPLPALLALAAAWKSMVEVGAHDIPLVIETGQVIDTHHVALLVAAGASAVFPYLALEQAEGLKAGGSESYRGAVEKGLRKVIARMGISTIASYRNSHLFEIIGLDPDVCNEFFEDASSSLAGKSLSALLQDCLDRHAAAFSATAGHLQDNGLYRFRRQGEQHASSPELVRRMHRYLKTPTEENRLSFMELGHQREPVAIRDLLEFVPGKALPLDEVETEASILGRFSTQAMSLGAISPETHRTLAIAMNRLGGRSNTGEGGEDPEIYRDGGEANNRVKQVASGRFGVTAEYLVHADELEIKIAQGAKPGEGGQLPASKVSVYIARLRHAVPKMMLISPPPHHDIYSIEDLAQLIYDLRAVNPRARIGVKLVASAGVGIIATGVAKAGADVITISGHDGGTGASPITSIKNTGIPWEVGLRDAHCALVRAGLRDRVRLRVDGGFKFARDVIVGALLGAEEFGFGTASLLALGCVMARQCHLNTCPVGIATQDEKLRTRFTGKPEMVETYFRAVAADVRAMLSTLGAGSIDEIRGQVERLRPQTPQAANSLAGLLDPIADPRQVAGPSEDDGTLYRDLNHTLVSPYDADDDSLRASRRRRFPITNADRAIGAHLSGEVLRQQLTPGAEAPAKYEFVGSAGQTFGGFLVNGLNFRLLGEANDYVGKSLSGGTISITAGPEASTRGDVLAGNTLLYGATSGELYIAGRVGERFAVRNSGALAVVEGVGQHGCEYMTAGVAVILGPAGMNLGAGMTGGLAYLLRDSIGGYGYNQHSVRLSPIEVREEVWLRRVLRKHVRLTGSPRAMVLLNSSAPLPFLRVEPLVLPCTIAQTWAPVLTRFRRPVMPAVYTVPIFATGALGAFLKTPVPKDRERSSAVQPGLA
jgi:glutamate synthase domain-containing protein 2/glutamate synthase domain-containing protein 1/glutamate synthase domain-containing protein 3